MNTRRKPRKIESSVHINGVAGIIFGMLLVLAMLGAVLMAYWGAGVTWGSTNGKSGLETSISNAIQDGGNLEDYATDWSSNNVTMFLWADSSVIPEPATIALLGLGGLALIRRRR